MNLHDAARKGDTERVRTLLANGIDVDQQNAYGWSALLIASYYEHFEIMNLLLDAGASVDVTNWRGYTALMISMYHDHLEVARILLDAGASIELCNNNGVRAYEMATPSIRNLIDERIQEVLDGILGREELPKDILKWVGTFVSNV